MVNEAGVIYVVDEQARSIRAFDADGNFISEAGRAGRGPGELAEMIRASLDGQGVIHVSDAGNLRISRFVLEGSTLRRLDEVKIESHPLDMCVIGDRRWVFQMHSGRYLIQEVGTDGSTIHEFAPREKARGEMGLIFGRTDHLFYSLTSLGCDAATSTIIMLHYGQPILRAFGLDGEEKWRREMLEGYHQMGYSNSGGCCSAGFPDPKSGTFHTASGVVPDGGGRVWITLQEVDPATRRYTYEARILDAGTGAELAALATEGYVAAIQGEFVYMYVQDPVPRVMVYALH
jgi:hypothetical protein